MPNNRQLAALILLGVAAVLMLLNRDLRSSLRSVFRAFPAPKFALSLLLMTLWVAGEILVARRFSWWDTSMTTSTLFWFAGSGFVLFLNAPKASEKEHFFRREFSDGDQTVSVPRRVHEPLRVESPVELALQVGLFFLFGLSAVASHKDEFKQVKKLVDALIGISVVGLVAYEVATIISERNTLGHSGIAVAVFSARVADAGAFALHLRGWCVFGV